MKEIHARIPNTHLVMHGSSSVPQDLLAIINQYGGKMKQTYGVPVPKEIQEAIKHGVRKINIDTDIRLAMTGAVRKFLAPGRQDQGELAQVVNCPSCRCRRGCFERRVAPRAAMRRKPYWR